MRNQPYATEFRIIRPDGQERFIQSETELAFDAEGNVVRVMGTTQDVTERARARQQLEQYTNQLRDQAELLDLARDMIFVHDMDGRIVFWNHGAELAYGWKREEALGQLSHKLLQTEYSEPLMRITARIIHQGWWEGELVHTTRDGRKLTVATRWALRRDPSSRPVAILEIDTDVTERRRAEHEMAEARRFAESIVETIQESLVVLDRQQLESLAEELLMTEERQRRQIATTLHDSIGQSLVFAKRELSILLQKATPETRDSLRQICEQITDAIQHTRDLTFELSPSTLYTFGLQAAVEELAEQFSECQGFVCRVECTQERMPLAEQIEAMLYRAIRELLVNVAKHAGAGRVVITMARNERTVTITVQDDGKGFDTSVLNGHSRECGFGLFSVRERLTRIGGKFSVESAAGRGTKITLMVPLELGQQGGRRV